MSYLEIWEVRVALVMLALCAAACLMVYQHRPRALYTARDKPAARVAEVSMREAERVRREMARTWRVLGNEGF